MPEGAAIHLRRKADGSVHLLQEGFPAEHAFNARHIARELDHPHGSMFITYVVLHTASHGDAVYELTGFGELDPDNPNDDRLNYGTWQVRKVSDAAAKKIVRATRQAEEAE